MPIKSLIVTIFLFLSSLCAFSMDSLTLQIITQSTIYTDQENYDQAINLLDQHLATLSKNQKLSIAAVQHKLGVNYYYTDELDKAIAAVSQAIELRSTALGELHPDTQNSLFLRLVIYRYFGKLEEALHDLERNIDYIQNAAVFTENEQDSILMNRYDELGNIYLELEDYHNAIFYWEEVRNYRIEEFQEEDLSVYQIEDQLAAAYKEIGTYEKAIVYFEKAIQYYNSSNPPLHEELCIAYTNLALTYDLTDQPQKASNLYEKATNSCSKANDEKNLLEVYTNQVATYTQLEQYRLAENAFQNALILTRQISSTDFKADLYTNKGQLEASKGNYDLALEYFDDAIYILVPDFEKKEGLSNPNPTSHHILSKYDLLQPLSQKAVILTKQGKHQDALEVYESIDDLVTAIRTGYRMGPSKFFLLQRTTQLYEKAIAAALQLYDQNADPIYLEKAYQFSAKNKASVLLEALQDASAKEFAGIPAEVLKEEKQWKKKIHEAETALYEAQMNGEKDLEDYSTKLFLLKQEYRDFVERLEHNYPNYYNLKYAFVEVPTIATLQAHLPSETTLLEYFIGEHNSYVFVLQQENFEVITLENTSNLIPQLKEFRHLLSSPAASSSEKQRLLDVAYRSYQLLIEPVFLKVTPTHRLLIVPDDILSQIAFESFLDQPADQIQAHTPFLLQKYAISYLYASSFLVKKQEMNAAPEIFAGFGIEYDDFTLKSIKDKGIVRGGTANAMRSVGQLTYSDDEVAAISKMLNGTSWLNQAATKSAFIHNAARFRILHLAMHGALNEQQPLQSALIFTKTSDTSDYLLRAGELYSLQLQAEMVVLSACNTGAGQINKGEGVRSLARAFQYAGASSLVASLWSAPDQTTKEITILFYQYLRKGLPKDIALQKARLNYLQDANTSPEYTHPSYWAHLIAIGDMKPLALGTDFSWKWWLLIIGGIIVVVLSMMYLKFRTNRST